MDTENDQKLNLCLHCRRRLLTCVCHLIKPFDTQTRFVILMHPMEFKKEKLGTGRFSHLILKNSEIIVGINFDEEPRLQQGLKDDRYNTFLLYPGDNAIDLATSDISEVNSRPMQFIILDGTWPCAKKMMKMTKTLHDLPRVSFTNQLESEFLIKHQPTLGCLSTVESIFQVISILNQIGIEHSQGLEQNLMDVFRYTVKQQFDLALDPTRAGYRKKPFRPASQRKISKKWSSRSLFYKGE